MKPRKLGRIGAGLLGLVGLVNNANAEDKLCIIAENQTTNQTTTIYNYHKEGTLEGNDGNDSTLLDNPLYSKINLYSRNTLCSPDRLKKDVRPLESMTTFSNEFEGVNLSGPVDVNVTYWTNEGFNNVNVISRLTDGNDNTLGIYDAKQLASHYPNSVLTIPVNNGITKKLKTEFYATADLDINGQVNIDDLLILQRNWLRNNVTQTEIYNPDNYSDINRDNEVNLIDFAKMSNQWLNSK